MVFDNVKYDEGIPAQYLCDVCKNPLLDAEIATPCGHSFCGFCVETFQATNGGGSITCQMCRQSVVAFCQNRLANNMLAMVEDECVWCHQRFPLNTAKDHVQGCGEVETECTQCHAPVKRANRNTHNDDCLMADIQCECGVLLKRAHADEHRRNMCALQEIDCPLKCAETIKRCMTASHSLVCANVAQKCSIEGSGHNIRRSSHESHMREHQGSHVKLLESQTSKALWNASRGHLRVTTVRSERGIFKWKLGDLPNTTRPLQSPTFNKFSRNWKIVYRNGAILLQFEQGVDEIAVFVSFIVHTRDGKNNAYVDKGPQYVFLKEGDCIQVFTGLSTSTSPESIIVKMEKTEPRIN